MEVIAWYDNYSNTTNTLTGGLNDIGTILRETQKNEIWKYEF